MPETARPASPDATSALGILAGGGALPLEIAASVTAAGRPVHIVAIDGFADTAVAAYPHRRVNLGQAGAMLSSLAGAGCRDLVIAGSLERPNLLRLKLDLGALRRIGVLLSLTRGGDDSVLRRVVRFFEAEGLRVVGVADVAPHLLAGSGDIAGSPPTAAHEAAIRRGAALVEALGPFDVGQAVVADADGIIAVEGVRGTDAMLRSLDAGRRGAQEERPAVLVKLAKPGQEMRVDLPTIGPGTIASAAAAGLAGIAVAAGRAIVIDRRRVVADAAASGLFVTGITGSEVPPPDLAADAMQEPALDVLARRAPTPADRRDIAVGRRLVRVLRAHGAGRAALIEREHVRAIAATLPVERMLAALGRGESWGLRAFRREIGILVLDVEGQRTGETDLEALPGVEVFRAALAAGLAGVVCLGAPVPAGRLEEMAAWANEARVFLMGVRGADTARGDDARP